MGETLRSCLFLALAFWVGGLTLFVTVVIPAAFRSLSKEEAGRLVGVIFPSVERWISMWAGVACGVLLVLFHGRHFQLRCLALELPVLVMAALTFYSAGVVQPEIQDVKKKMQHPEFKGTAHLEKLRASFDWHHRLSVGLHSATLFLGWFTLALAARLLP